MFYLKKLTSFMFLERGIVSLVNLTKKEESGIFKTEKSDIGKKNNPDKDKTKDTGIVKKDQKFSGGRWGMGEKNVDNFLLNLYKEVSVEKKWQSDELSDLKSATKEMVNRIVNEAVSPFMKEDKSKGLTEVIVSEAGSMADGTSIIDPDEFDFTMAFVFSKDAIETRPSSNGREYSLPKFKVKAKDPRFKQVYINNKPELTDRFVRQHFRRLECALAKTRGNVTRTVRRGDKYLYMCASDEYGMHGPSFHLHKLLRWRSPNRKTDLIISVDLVPAIQLNDKTTAETIPLFIPGCQCAEHKLGKPVHYLLMPMRGREDIKKRLIKYNDARDKESKDTIDFLTSHFMISFSGYENDLLKKWQCEKSMYHNWYICYTLMKCFGKLDHDCSSRDKYPAGRIETHIDHSTIPERNESFSSYSWKNKVFTEAQKEGGKFLSLSQCFDCLTSEFEEDNLKNMECIEIGSFCWPLEIAEIVDIRKNDSGFTQYVEGMKRLKFMMNEIEADPNYSYEKYKKKLVEIFPELAPHLK